MKMPIATLSTIAKYWNQHKYLHAQRRQFLQFLWTFMLCLKINMALLEECAEYWGYFALFSSVYFQQLGAFFSSSPICHRAGILTTTWHPGSWIWFAFCQWNVFAWDLEGRREARASITLPSAPTVDTWTLSDVSFCRNQQSSCHPSTWVLWGSGDCYRS